MTDTTTRLPRRRSAPKTRVAPVEAPALAPSAAAPAGPEAEDQTMTTTFDHVADTAATAQDQAQATATDFAARTQGAMDKGKEMVSEMTTFAKGNVEAMVEATGIYTRGLETFGQDAAAFAKKSYEDAAAAMKAMTAAKSPTELMKLQSDYTRAAFDAMVAETSRSTEKMVKLVGEAVQPISNRVSVAVEKTKLAA